jgi:hypothetical protein
VAVAVNVAVVVVDAAGEMAAVQEVVASADTDLCLSR